MNNKRPFACALLALCTLILCAALSAKAGDAMKDRIANMDKNRQAWRLPESVEKTDPELAAIRDRLVLGEIVNSGSLGEKGQALVALAGLIAVSGLDGIAPLVESALNVGVDPVAIRETCYQCVPYVGFPRVEAALALVNNVFSQRKIALPLEKQGTVTEQSRLNNGMAAQKGIFGKENIEKMQDNAPEGQKEIVVNYLSAYCFGDFYTRKGLDLKTRELVVFSAIVALGGCDPQARAHAGANAAVGNTKQNLVDALATLVPIIGFPRTLNGLAAVNAALP